MISALVVSHNTRELLLHCLAELTARCDEGLEEILVVDNASSDGSVEAVRARYPSVRLMALPGNVGFGTANNLAATLARGDRWLLINSDAWLEPGSLDALDRALTSDPRLAAVAPRLVYPDGRPQFHWAPATGVVGEVLQKLRNRWEHRSWVHREPPRWMQHGALVPWYSGACWLVRPTAFRAVGGFDPAFFLYFEDVDLCRRWRLGGWRLATAAGATAIHHKGGSQHGDASSPRTPGVATVEYRRSQLRYYRRHRPTWEERVLRRRLHRRVHEVTDPETRAALEELLAS